MAAQFSPWATLLTQERPSLGSISCIAPGSSEAWQPRRSPRGLSACLGGFPRKLAFRLVSAEPGSSCQHLCLPLESSPCRFGPDVCKAVSWQPEARAGAAHPVQQVFPPAPCLHLEERRCCTRPALQVGHAACHLDEAPAVMEGWAPGRGC